MSSRTEKPLLSSCMVTRFLKIRQTGLQTDSSRDLQRNIDGSSERARHESIRRERRGQSQSALTPPWSPPAGLLLWNDLWTVRPNRKPELTSALCQSPPVGQNTALYQHLLTLKLAALFSDKPRITHLTQQDSSPPGWDPQSPASPHTESLCHCRGSVAVS